MKLSLPLLACLALLGACALGSTTAEEHGALIVCDWVPKGQIVQLDVIVPPSTVSKGGADGTQFPQIHEGEGMTGVDPEKVAKFGPSEDRVAKKVEVKSQDVKEGDEYEIIRSFWRLSGSDAEKERASASVMVQFSRHQTAQVTIHVMSRSTKSGKQCLLPFQSEDGSLLFDCREGVKNSKLADGSWVTWKDDPKEYCITDNAGEYYECEEFKSPCSSQSAAFARRHQPAKKVLLWAYIS